jgi:hypothetical protein
MSFFGRLRKPQPYMLFANGKAIAGESSERAGILLSIVANAIRCFASIEQPFTRRDGFEVLFESSWVNSYWKSWAASMPEGNDRARPFGPAEIPLSRLNRNPERLNCEPWIQFVPTPRRTHPESSRSDLSIFGYRFSCRLQADLT